MRIILEAWRLVVPSKVTSLLHLSTCRRNRPTHIAIVHVYDNPLHNYNPLHWCHNGHDGVSNHQTHHFLFNHLFGRRSKKTSKLRVTGLCAGNSAVTGEFPAQMASNVENVSIWWRHHAKWSRYFNTQSKIKGLRLPQKWFPVAHDKYHMPVVLKHDKRHPY